MAGFLAQVDRFPIQELRHKFLMAQPSDAQELIRDIMHDGLQVSHFLAGTFFDTCAVLGFGAGSSRIIRA